MKKWKIAGLMVCAMMIATLFPAAAEPESLDSTENVRDNDYQLIIVVVTETTITIWCVWDICVTIVEKETTIWVIL